jgi:hypothetical protein
MAQHRFKVGQMVNYHGSHLGVPASSREYKIVRQLPIEAGDLQYRIKSPAEAFERVAKERDLIHRNLVE